MKERALKALERVPLPDKLGVYNGVTARDMSWYRLNDCEPDHKQQLTNAVLERIAEGDSVICVGGGRGVVPVHAARIGCDVTVYEAASEYVKKLQETARLNDVDLTVRHAVVGKPGDVFGTLGSCDYVSPEELSGDVLVLDCEGAETSILPVDGFESVVVESHPKHGATTDMVIEATGGEVYGPDPMDGDVIVA